AFGQPVAHEYGAHLDAGGPGECIEQGLDEAGLARGVKVHLRRVGGAGHGRSQKQGAETAGQQPAEWNLPGHRSLLGGSVSAAKTSAAPASARRWIMSAGLAAPWSKTCIRSGWAIPSTASCSCSTAPRIGRASCRERESIT